MKTTLELVLACGQVLAAVPAAGQCPNVIWSPQFGTPKTGLSGSGSSLRVFDADGPGPGAPALFVGGYFQTAGGVVSPGIARWDGVAWSSVGGGVAPGGFPGVSALGTFDADGPGPGLPVLVAAGGFTSAGGVGANRIAAWNGVAWAAMGQGLPEGFAVGMVEYDPDGTGGGPPELWVAGDFNDGFAGVGIARWDGATWSLLQGAPMARAIAVFDEDGPGPEREKVFLGLPQTPGLVRWSGSEWQTVGGGLWRSGLYICNTLCVVDEDGSGPGRTALLVGGAYTHTGTLETNSIARWSGQAWSGLGNGIGDGFSLISDIAAVDTGGPPDIYAFVNGLPGQLTAVMRWSGGQWSVEGTSTFLSYMMQFRLASFAAPGEASPSLYVTGPFSTMGGVAARSIARLRCECYANCDDSQATPRLTGNDFVCFVNRFATGDPYANCDESTGAPVLTGNDFVCFVNAYAEGCS